MVKHLKQLYQIIIDIFLNGIEFIYLLCNTSIHFIDIILM